MNNKQIALLILLTLISTVQVFLVQFLVVDFSLDCCAQILSSQRQVNVFLLNLMTMIVI